MGLTRKSRSAVLGALVFLAVLVGPGSSAALGQAALEEYVLSLPNVDTSTVGEAPPLADLAQRADPVGVTGETEPGPTPLGAVAGAMVSPAGLVLALGALGLVAAAIAGRRRNRA